MRVKKIETTGDVRYKAYKEMLSFINWLAENHPKDWRKYNEQYLRKK